MATLPNAHMKFSIYNIIMFSHPNSWKSGISPFLANSWQPYSSLAGEYL
jgi:hypothetical protein